MGGTPRAPGAGTCRGRGPASQRISGAARGPGRPLGGTRPGRGLPRRFLEGQAGVRSPTTSGPARRRPASRGLPGWDGVSKAPGAAIGSPRGLRGGGSGQRAGGSPWGARGRGRRSGLAYRAARAERVHRRPVTQCRLAHPAAATCGDVRPGAEPETDSPLPATDTDVGRCVSVSSAATSPR